MTNNKIMANNFKNYNQMNKKLFHIEFKNASESKKHFYYGDLTILYNSHNDIQISKSYLEKKDFSEPFENEICIIRKSELVVSTRSRK